MQLEFKIKPFNELSTIELYKILRLRSEVFVVEQNCVYQDIDGKDQKAIHVLGYYDGVLAAYSVSSALVIFPLNLFKILLAA